MIKLMVPLFCFFTLLLIIVIFSFSQVDLNLTLAPIPTYIWTQKLLWQIGYFNRPLSTWIWSLFFILLFGFYFWFLKRSYLRQIDLRFLKIIIGISLLLLLAYPAFSYDLFNYIFDARIVVHYHLSPYHFKALDFPYDPWTRFMHWTHRYYPYGPIWLWLTIPVVFLGMGKFVMTLTLFKLVFGLFHLANCLLIYKIARIMKIPAIPAVLFYALNPLVLIESLLSPHNEVMLLTFTLLGIYLLFEKKIILSVMSIFIGAAIKYLNIYILPLLLFWKKKLDTKFIEMAIWLWFIFLVPLIIMREFYTWYLLPPIGLVSITPQNKLLNLLVIGLSGGLLARYLPYLYLGNYTAITGIWQLALFIILTFLTSVIWYEWIWSKKTSI